MARVTYGALITELAGSIGGITFQKNSSGNIARLKPNMPVNSSANQQLQQINLSKIIPAWNALSSGQKAGWEAFAAAHDHVNEWNETKTLNGFQWFASCNLNLLITSQAMIAAAPAWTAIAAPAAFTVYADIANLWLEWSVIQDFFGYKMLVYATSPILQNTIKLRRSTYIIRISDGDEYLSLNIQSQYESAFNVTWATFYAAAVCNIIARFKLIQNATGLASPFTSGRIKLN